MTETPFDTKVTILADLWLNYRNDEAFDDFCDYNDIGLPLAYCVANKIVNTTPLAETFISETFDLLLGAMELEDDGFDSLDDILGQAQQ